ncbi:unnamed protein product [Calypogeia fissa]
MAGWLGDGDDDWLAMDKLQHFLACLLITNFVAHIAGRLGGRRVRRWRVHLGALSALVAGAAKEAVDATGLLWKSSGPSLRDGVADMAGVVAGVFLEIVLFSRFHRVLEERPSKNSGEEV